MGNTYIFILLVYICLLTAIPIPTAHAEETGLKISPSLFQIHSNAPNDIQVPFSIENEQSNTIRLHIGYKIIDKTLSQDGIVSFLNDSSNSVTDTSIFSNLQIIDDTNTSLETIALGPHQKKQLYMRLTLPKETPTADYYFSILLTEEDIQLNEQNESYINKKDQKSVSSVLTGIGMNVLLSVGGDTLPQASIYEFTTPFYAQEKPIPLTLKVSNTGSHYINPKGEIVIKNIFGKTIETIDIPPTTILAGTTRKLSDNLHYTTNTKGISLNNQFLLGIYSASVRLYLSSNGPYLTKTIQFVAFPQTLLIALVVFIPTLFYVYRRVKNKLKQV